jgi:adenosylhomocysteine nucleosidase
MPKIAVAIIAGMEREVRPLVRSWQVRTIDHDGRRYRLFENAEAALICGGIGAEAARRATEAVIEQVHPTRVISAGFAGALDGSLKVGDVFVPRVVIGAGDGVRTEIGSGEGVLVSFATMAGNEQKTRLRTAYGAHAVDMEAAAVAEGARAREIEFEAVKAISDAAGFDLPAMDRFVREDGSFQSRRFLAHVALRPRLWGATIALARNSAKASRALCGALGSFIASYPDRQTIGPTLTHESSNAKLNPTIVGTEYAGAHTVASSRSHTQADGN